MPADLWTAEDVELVAGWFKHFFGASVIRRRDRECATEILAALAEAGRLSRPDDRLAAAARALVGLVYQTFGVPLSPKWGPAVARVEAALDGQPAQDCEEKP